MKTLLLALALAVTAPVAFAAPPASAEPAAVRQALYDGLSAPVGMAFDGQGNLYIANWSAGAVARFDPQGRRTIFAQGLNGPSGLAIAPSGEIYVASYHDDLVWKITPKGEKTVFVRGLSTPAGLSFDARGRLLIANRQRNQILAADPSGKLSVVASDLRTPVGAVELQGGDLVVSNLAGGITLVSPTGQGHTLHDGMKSPGPGIVADGDGVYVVDYGGSTVRRIDRQGRVTMIADGLGSPVGLVKTPDGNLLVATWRENAVFSIKIR